MADVATPMSMPTAASARGNMPLPAPVSQRVDIPRPAQPPHNLKIDTMSPVTQNGSFAFDRIIKSGDVLKRTRKTKAWKPRFIVLRPNLLSIYRDSTESKLRQQVNLSDVTAVARQKDPKRQGKHVFGVFTPARNYHLEASTEQEAQEWVELIRRQARIDDAEEEMYLASPGGAATLYHGFGRSIDAVATAPDDRGGYSSSDIEAISSVQPLPRQRDRGNTGVSAISAASSGRPPHMDYSGPEYGSFSDVSDLASPAARLSNLSLATDPRPSTSSTQPHQHVVYGSRPSMGVRTASQVSGIGTQPQEDPERIVYNSYIFLLRSTRGVRSWKKIWMVLRPKALALYKDDSEYSAMLILPFNTIIDVVEIDPISRSKTSCMQIISEERNYRFCALDEESLARWLGAFKSLLSKRKAKQAAAAQSGHANAAGCGTS